MIKRFSFSSSPPLSNSDLDTGGIKTSPLRGFLSFSVKQETSWLGTLQQIKKKALTSHDIF